MRHPPLSVLLVLVAAVSGMPALPGQSRSDQRPSVRPIDEPLDDADAQPGGAGGKYGGRKGGRKGLAKGGKVSADAIEAGLRWLALHQDPGGRWDAEGFMKHDPPQDRCDGKGVPDQDVAVTALALLAFLGDGATARSGPFRKVVERASGWLVGRQAASGVLGDARLPDFGYGHALATWALVEAYGLSGAEELGPPAQKAVAYLEAHRNPGGAWGLQPRDGVDDASVTCWCLMACKIARDFRLQTDGKVFEEAGAALDRLTAPTGALGLVKRGDAEDHRPLGATRLFGPESEARLTAAGLLARFFLGQSPAASADVVRAAGLALSAGAPDLLTAHWRSLALYQMGGRHWAEASKELTAAVVKTQRAEGAAAGSWDPQPDGSCPGGGRIGATALGVLSLETYYRFTRLVR